MDTDVFKRLFSCFENYYMYMYTVNLFTVMPINFHILSMVDFLVAKVF